jgi:hypothetical protein
LSVRSQPLRYSGTLTGTVTGWCQWASSGVGASMRTLWRPLRATVLSQVPSEVVSGDSKSQPVGRPPGDQVPASKPALAIRLAGGRHSGAASAAPARPIEAKASDSRRSDGTREEEPGERMTVSLLAAGPTAALQTHHANQPGEGT